MKTPSDSGNSLSSDMFAPLMVCALCYAGYLYVVRKGLIAQIWMIALTILASVFAVVVGVLCLAALMDKKYIPWRNSFLHLAAGIILGTFIYRMIQFPIIWSDWTFLAHAGLSVFIIGYYNARFHKQIFSIVQNRKLKKEQLEAEKKRMNTLLHCNLDPLSEEETNKLLTELKMTIANMNEVRPTHREYQFRLLEIKRHQDTLKQDKEMNELREKNTNLEKNLHAINQNNAQEAANAQDQKQQIREDLIDQDTPVFIKEGLGEDAIEILREMKYTQTNEYDISEQKIITVFTKPILNHSSTHTFLTWSVKRFLESADEEITKIEEHETRDADITFQHHNKTYAIEIETGSLLKVKQQLHAKVAYLNKKYPHRWLFVVSNKNLQPAYRKYGLATHRSQVAKTLQKMLKSPTHQKRVAHETPRGDANK